MAVPDVTEKYAAALNTVTIGATKAEGGTRSKAVTVGGAKGLPWLGFEGERGQPQVIAVEVWDAGAEAWPAQLKEAYGDSMNDLASWCKKAVEFGAEMICLKLMGTHPDGGDRTPAQAAESVKTCLEAVDVPLIVWGCGVYAKDNNVMPKCTEAAKGENCLFGTIVEKNYATLVAACLASGHKILAESPLDVNIAKQVNILASDAGFPVQDIVSFPTTAALGYGMEYVYSIQERMRLAAVNGDKQLQQPILMDIGMEAWRAKESKIVESEAPELGPAEKRGPMWEALTATNLLQSGGDILVMRHPEAIRVVRKAMESLSAA
ncbi:MAG: acetyl-CoA decarbonylase/synthase complex subunit delta [Phycisphaerae bacterium]|nr:acetyl-CoA decarbonylase/synthase complex subunit delta [Phycisphaerae bacterium]